MSFTFNTQLYTLHFFSLQEYLFFLFFSREIYLIIKYTYISSDSTCVFVPFWGGLFEALNLDRF
jgi:hypothetical protein